jgi:hypothetical protein
MKCIWDFASCSWSQITRSIVIIKIFAKKFNMLFLAKIIDWNPNIIGSFSRKFITDEFNGNFPDYPLIVSFRGHMNKRYLFIIKVSVIKIQNEFSIIHFDFLFVIFAHIKLRFFIDIPTWEDVEGRNLIPWADKHLRYFHSWNFSHLWEWYLH